MKKIQINSRDVKKGDVFVAIPCANIDKNIREAIKNNASVIIVDSKCNYSGDVFLCSDDVRLAASKLSAFCYNQSPKNCFAVTGTNGKSSVVHFLTQIWQHIGINSASLGTNGLFINGEKFKDNDDITVQKLTTPDCVNLHQILNFLKSKKEVDYFAFEASSHALDQKRLHSVELQVSAFTNLYSDHLDYHKTKEHYFESKKKLFSEIKSNVAVISRDDEYVYNSLKNLHNNIITYGLNNKNDIYADNIRELPDRIIFDLHIKSKSFKNICINIFGGFQILNVLCSIAMAIATNDNCLSVENISSILHKVKQLEGRMEHIASYHDANIYVDFAHTASSFEKAISTFKNIVSPTSRLIVVFGCGGERDTSKRQLFGETSHRLADVCIVTDDNPRNEDPKEIRSNIIKYCPGAVEIPSRVEAIKYGISILKPHDVLIVIGKGHEKTQIYANNNILHHNDSECIRKIILENQ